MEAPDDIVHDMPFQAVNPDSCVTVPIQADSLAGAVAQALERIASSVSALEADAEAEAAEAA